SSPTPASESKLTLKSRVEVCCAQGGPKQTAEVDHVRMPKSHITQDEVKNIMKRAVDTVYKLLWLKQNDPEKYEATLEFGNRHTRFWDEPKADVS
ncbi:MAG: hypothetical protein ABSG40_19865, partial [Terriglobales bacterium]